MPYFHGVSYVFSRSKKIDTACSFLEKAFRIKVSKRTRWSKVLLPWRNPHCILDKSPLESRNYTRRALIISSNCRYIDNVLSLNKSRFVDYLHLINPNELEVKNTTDNQKSASYLEIDNGERLTTKLYDKRDDFIFSIVNFLFIKK